MQEELQSQEQVKKATPSGFRALFDYLEILVIAVCVVFLIFTFAVRLCNVSGPSMEKTLFNNEKLLVSNLFYTPKQGDIIVFHQTVTNQDLPYYDRFNETIIKRVIATGGDTVLIDFDKGTVTVNGERLEEPYLPEQFSYTNYRGTEKFVVPEGKLFVMGDNRNNSTDSRSPVIGFVDERRVLGRVLCRVLPFSRFGTVE